MTDVLTKEQRSYNMSRINSKGTKPEIKMKRLLDENKIYGYKTHYKIEGNPDFVFSRKKIVVFVDGCFWHKCPTCYVAPKSNDNRGFAPITPLISPGPSDHGVSDHLSVCHYLNIMVAGLTVDVC